MYPAQEAKVYREREPGAKGVYTAFNPPSQILPPVLLEWCQSDADPRAVCVCVCVCVETFLMCIVDRCVQVLTYNWLQKETHAATVISVAATCRHLPWLVWTSAFLSSSSGSQAALLWRGRHTTDYLPAIGRGRAQGAGLKEEQASESKLRCLGLSPRHVNSDLRMS